MYSRETEQFTLNSIRKQRVIDAAKFTFSFYFIQSRIPAQGIVPSTMGGHPISITLFKMPHRHGQGPSPKLF